MTQHTRESILARVGALRAGLPQLIAAHPDDADFWPAFAGLADEIKADAGSLGDEVWFEAFDRLQSMLYEHGKISAEELDP